MYIPIEMISVASLDDLVISVSVSSIDKRTSRSVFEIRAETLHTSLFRKEAAQLPEPPISYHYSL